MKRRDGDGDEDEGGWSKGGRLTDWRGGEGFNVMRC